MLLDQSWVSIVTEQLEVLHLLNISHYLEFLG